MRRSGGGRSSEALSRRSAAGNVRTLPLPLLAPLLALTACGAFGTVAAACVEGVTPDCSDAATPCGPDSDASGDVLEAQPLPEAARPDTAAPPDAEGPEAGDLDAGDEV